jgi:protein-disulfide isomerase
MMNAATLALGAAFLRPGKRIAVALSLLLAAGLGGMAYQMYHASTRSPLPAEVMAKVTQEEAASTANSIGPADAPVTIVEFSDLQCPMCRVFHEPLTKFQQSNPAGVRLVFRNRPLMHKAGHELSGAAAKLSEIAAEKGKFWEFVERFYLLQGKLNLDEMVGLFPKLGFDKEVVKKRLADPHDPAQARAERDLDLAEKWKITTTPTFLVFVKGFPPQAAQGETLRTVLNTPTVEKVLAEVRNQKKTTQK